ncbi:anillin-like isoform X4 [Limulus polyphemus]|uniref:Anillin-like isoform X4 n=1 Tax=Limulus polyphemus TaxID=6850 RepID=A0ABM1TA19_LIMPO|nr:anillin-like isoform X4 [Limulus polyphemus]
MESDIDPFTKKLLERTQARRENLNKKIAQMSEANSRKRRTPLTEEIPSSQFLNNDGAVPQDESPKRQCVDSPKEKFENYSKETPAIQVEDVEKENAPQDEGSEEFAVSDTLQGVRGLAALRRKKLESECMEVDSQPSSVVPVQFVAEHEEAQGFTKSPSASKINYNFNKENKAVIKEQTIQENTSKIPNNEKTIGEKPPTPSFKSSASLVLSKNTEVDSQRSEDGKLKCPPKPLPTSSQPSQEPKKNIDPSDLPLSARRALFEKAMRDGNSKAQQELSNPETLSVAARAALFDKSMSKASQPVKSTVTSSRPATSMTQSKQVSQPTLQTTKAVSTSETATKPNSPVKSVLSTSSTNSNKSSLVESPTSSASSLASPGKNVGMNTRQVQEQLLQKAQNDWRGNEISAKTKEERRREMTALMNRWERASSSSTCSETTNVDNPNKLTDTNKPQFLPSESSDVGNDVPDDVFQAEDLNSSESEASDIISEPENVPGPATSTCHFREPEENTCEKMNQEEDDDDEADLTGEAAAVCAEIDELLDEALDEEDEKEKEEKEFGTFDTNVSEKQVSVHQNGDSSSYTPQPPPKKTCAVTCTNFSL